MSRARVDVWAFPGARLSGAEAVRRLVASGFLPGQPRYVRSNGERPVLHGREDLGVSVSRTEGMTLVALAHGCRVGVDVEAIRDRGLLRLPEHALAAPERRELDRRPPELRLEAFLDYWTRKEAVLKAAGLGLSVEPSLVELPPPGGAGVLDLPACLGDPATWTVAGLPVPGFATACAADVPSVRIRLRVMEPRSGSIVAIAAR